LIYWTYFQSITTKIDTKKCTRKDVLIHTYTIKLVLWIGVKQMFIRSDKNFPWHIKFQIMSFLQRRFHEMYGPIFKEKLGPVTNVSIADPHLVEEVVRSEGKFPNRPRNV
jgi:hypothetical protein